METPDAEVLPYRTEAEQLARWVEARARGRASAQLRELDLAPKTLEGTLATAAALGFLDRESQELTPAGQRLALASPAERRTLLRAAMREYPPYARLLRAVAARPQRGTTDAQWIETWWATHGHGSSQSNRVEGVAAFGRLVEHVGWGRYIPGRRGHPTRVEWSAAAFEGLDPPPPADADPPAPPPEEAPAVPPPAPREAPPPAAASPEPAPEAGYNRIVVPLRSGEVARLEVPLRLSREEKRRLVELLDLLITTE